MAILTLGIDLAKNVFALHGVNQAGKPELLRPSVARSKLNELVAALPCTIGIEAYSGAHYWARRFGAYGHSVKLMAPKLVAPYRMSGKRGKNDAADAQAICEAVQRPNMHFVPIKTEEQQSRLMVRRAQHLAWCDERIAAHAKDNEAVKAAATLLGIGPVTASAVVATAGDFKRFKNGTQFGAWIGLTPPRP